ncbi:uncharacterized protein LY79DRAFT_151756 [Colletotrichum navitas]|uniref:Uncharacterized protein n=1 Tax=Colletotrichum navitas TaxID=681940 RepID=A0AAD8V9X5_9PEZI|nr:uncharacterized protein LY79DRAFT_151756 [Colletotrichum navitas]KAK1599792.1 hypothetical protein LY79DRAFT_151756 [Colletotrichum navitas]
MVIGSLLYTLAVLHLPLVTNCTWGKDLEDFRVEQGLAAPLNTFSMWIMLEVQHAMTWSCINETGPLIFSPFIVHLRRAPTYIQS